MEFGSEKNLKIKTAKIYSLYRQGCKEKEKKRKGKTAGLDNGVFDAYSGHYRASPCRRCKHLHRKKIMI